MKKFFTIITVGIVCSSGFPSLAQMAFSRFFLPLSETISINAINQTSDGGYILAGKITDITSGALSDFFMAKFNSIGDTVWTQRIGGSGTDYATSVQQTNDSGFIVGGSTNSYGAGGYDILLVKTDATGNVQWSKTYGGTSSDYIYSVRQNTDSGYVLSGSIVDSKMLVIRTNASGDTLWTRQMANSAINSHAQAYYSEQTPDGGFIVTGQIDSLLNYTAHIIVKLNATGNKVWSRCKMILYFTLAEDSYAKPTLDGGYVVVYRHEPDEIYLFKFDSAGNLQVVKQYKFPFMAYNLDAVCIKQLPDNTYSVFASGPNAPESVLMKLNATCDTMWTKKLDVNGSDAVFGADGSLAVSFSGNGSGGGIHKLDTLFNSECMVSNSSSCMYGIYNFPGSIDVANIGGGITVSEITVGNVAYSARESHSPCATGLNETMEESSVSIFPNPATNQVEIRNPKFEIRNIEFYNLLGEKLFSNSVTSNQEHVTVNVSKLSPGIYFVKVKGEKVESVGKFVKQ